ncbi:MULTISPECIES: VOC family protein [Streptomyces]|uniref:VOC family protein n=1 Tax=Streptomyces spirodelae TaxID=2812904 RepID=A0ABS3WYE7_9ACTN|nr:MULTISPECIES: VOC family protein [Streptomyces]MBO8188101.1 VOC family protein [Streptomyces spirodelae]UNZ19926.1 VOC family protein [Streptomyces sp. 891-h]
MPGENTAAAGDDIRAGQPTLFTGDIEAMAAFYRTIGFVETYRFPTKEEPVFITLKWSAFHLTLADEAAVRASTGLDGIGASTGRRFDITVIVEDVDKTVGALREAGAPVVLDPRDQPWGDRHAYVTDPEGNYVQITTHSNHDFGWSGA